MHFKYLSLLSLAIALGACSEDNPSEPEVPSSSSEASSSVASSSSSVSSSSIVVDSLTLIEDFEDGDSDNLKLGYWYTFSSNGDPDAENGGSSNVLTPTEFTEAFVTDEGYKSDGMFKINVELIKNTYTWAPYEAFGTIIPKADSIGFSPVNYDGITYWHKGVAHEIRIDIPEVTNHNNFRLKVPESKEWKLITIDFLDLKQEDWGDGTDPQSLNLDQDIKVVWELRNGSGDFALDDIRFIKEIIYEPQYDMEILEAEPPTALEADGDVTSTLNDLSKKYLTKGLNFTNWGEQSKIDSSKAPEDWKFNEASVIKQANQGMKGLRLPIDLDLYILERDSVFAGTKTDISLEPFLFTVLDSFNVWTKRHGLSYTIDHHAYDGTFTREAAKNPVYRVVMSTVWKLVAEHYLSETREDLFYELTNEPGLSVDLSIIQADWKATAQMMIDSIRTVDATRPIIFGDVDYYNLDQLVKNTPFTDQYVIYAFHMYDPFIFTHQGASWSGIGSTKNTPFPYSEEAWSTEYRDFGITGTTPAWIKSAYKRYYKEGNKTFIKNRLIKVKNWAYEHQVPLICNEWGAYPKSAKIEDLNAYFKTMAEIFVELDISWQVWFGIMDPETYDLLPGMAEAMRLN